MDAKRSALDLRPVGPLSILDRAFSLAREGGSAVWVPAWIGGALFAMPIVAAFYVERIEGIHSLRLAFAVALVLGFWGRALLLGQVARRVVRRLWEAEPAPEAGRAIDVLRTSMVVGVGLWIWAWLFVAGSLLGPIGVLLPLPLIALRGAIAPSWIARSACEADGGLRAFIRATADSANRRFAGILTESMMLVGAVALSINLFAAFGFAMLFARSFAGLDVSSVETFMSPDNTFVLLVVAATALVLLEPVRAALSALGYVDARVREDGLDLRASIEDAIRHSRPRSSSARAAAIVIAIVLASAASARAQHEEPAAERPAPIGEATPIATAATAQEDDRVDDDLRSILARPEFRDFEDRRGEGIRELFERLLEWLLRPRDVDPSIAPPAFSGIALPSGGFFLALGALLLIAVAVYLVATRSRGTSPAVTAQATREGHDPRERPPTSFLDEAAALAEQGQLREALRALYLATLVALDRRRMMAFDPHLTNWQYLRQMPRGAVRDAFAQFTRMFDHKWYGHEVTAREDYERCRALADRIVSATSVEEAA